MCFKDNEYFRILTSVALLTRMMGSFEALLCESWKPLRVFSFEPVNCISMHQTAEVTQFQ